MTWRKPSAALSALLEEALSPFKCQERKMFGCPAYFVNNNMFAGVHQDNLFIRLSEEDREEVSSTYDEVVQFEPVEGRRMREYVVLPDSLCSDPDTFQKWLNRSYQYVSSLPPKEPRTKRKKK